MKKGIFFLPKVFWCDLNFRYVNRAIIVKMIKIVEMASVIIMVSVIVNVYRTQNAKTIKIVEMASVIIIASVIVPNLHQQQPLPPPPLPDHPWVLPPVYLHLIFEISSVTRFFFNFEISSLKIKKTVWFRNWFLQATQAEKNQFRTQQQIKFVSKSISFFGLVINSQIDFSKIKHR